MSGVLFALTGFLIFSGHDALIKLLGGSYSAFQIVFFTVLLSFPFLSVMLVRDQTFGTLRPRYPGWSALRTGSVVITGLCAFYAFTVLPLAQAYAIMFASPLVITLLSIPILGERVHLRRWLAVLVGLGGVLVVLRPGDTTELTLGHGAALVSACGGALSSVIQRRIGGEERRVVLLIYPMLANFVVMLAALPFVYQPMPVQDFGLFIGMALLSLIAMNLMIRAYQYTEAAIVAPMQYSQIVWAVLIGFVFFNEMPDRNTLIGAGIIIASGIYIILREGRSGVSDGRPVLSNLSRRVDTGTFPRLGALKRRPSKRN